ncbi:hypothetical protein [Streptomyces acidiscabies]|uniref:Transcriptional regulator n=1 Tax=Streptomyces acidiscabies TaxID=42234 RepID=A0A0L0KKD5_9ACTN|nr:hypothetical protein [Streptomyces acidiscabies]KND38293.1 transcriptional regulator [Streptomyces acidiscabies]
MLATPSETPACPKSADRQRRLALQLADMIPGAATLRVNLQDPKMAWPTPHARAWDAAGQTIDLSRTTAQVAARWVLRVWPNVDWSVAHTLDLTAATLTSAARGR